MRLYTFSNMYLSRLQVGLQSAHVTHELFLKYPSGAPLPHSTTNSTSQSRCLWDWAQNHKTMILLNGGYSASLRELIKLFDSSENPYPWAYFNESEEAADGLLTCVGIVLPEKIYETAKALRDGNIGAEQIRVTGSWSPEDDITWTYTKWEHNLCLELNKYGMAI